MTNAAFSIVDAGGTMNGLLMVQQTKLIGPVIDDLLMIWAASEAEEWIGQVRFLRKQSVNRRSRRKASAEKWR